MFPSAHRAAHRQLCTWLRTEVDARQRSIENTFERDVQKLEMAVRRKVSVYKGKLSERETEASRYEATIDDAKSPPPSPPSRSARQGWRTGLLGTASLLGE